MDGVKQTEKITGIFDKGVEIEWMLEIWYNCIFLVEITIPKIYTYKSMLFLLPLCD